MPKFDLVKDKNHFIPAGQSDMVKCMKIGQGEIIRCRSVDQRNVKFLRKYWALVDIILQNLPEPVEEDLIKNHQFRIKTKDDVHFYIKIKNGFVEKKYVGKDGNIAWFPKSISFDKMNEVEFEEFFSKAVDTACELLTVESDELIKEIMDFL